MTKTRTLVACLLALSFTISVVVERAASADLIPAIELGYDRFAQVFRFTDATIGDDGSGNLELGSSLRDTTDIFTELRAQGELRLLDSDGSHRYDVLALGAVGSSMNRALFNGWYRYRPPDGIPSGTPSSTSRGGTSSRTRSSVSAMTIYAPKGAYTGAEE